MTGARAHASWKHMGILTALLSAIGCGPASKRPTLADYEASLHPQRALRLDPAVATSGRFELVAGDMLVLDLHASAGRSRIAYDKGSDWRVVVELPPGTDPAAPLDVPVDGLPAIARVAGEDVVYLARGARGRVKLAPRTSGEPVRGELDLVFEAADRDLIGLGALRLAGPFQAKLR